MSKLSLQFNGIFDLHTKFDKIKMVHELVNKLYKNHLLENGVPFTELNDYGVIIDLGKVPDSKKQFIENPFKGMIKTVYEQTGVQDLSNT